MKFKLKTSGISYETLEKEKLEKLGFVFEQNGLFLYPWSKKTEPEIKITTLKELLDFVKEYGEVIVSEGDNAGEWTLEIYDNYRE